MRYQSRPGLRSMTTANDLAVRRALEAAGVMFIDENGGAGPVCGCASRNEKALRSAGGPS